MNVFGLSTQASDYQQEMVARLQVPFPVLSDAELRFTHALGLPTFETGGQTYLERLSLLLNEGAIEQLFYPVPSAAAHARDVLDAYDPPFRRTSGTSRGFIMATAQKS